MQPEYSVVIPFYNEQGAVSSLLCELRITLTELGFPHEIYLIDDGSTDDTAKLLKEAASDWPFCTVVSLPTNQGQAAALFTGLYLCSAPWIITMDGDGQNDPADIPLLIAGLDGADMIVGIRGTRKDSWFRIGMSRLANAVRRRFLRDGVRDSGCALKVFRREIIGAFWPIKSLYSFVPAMAVAAGYRVSEMNVRHRPRISGKTNYGFGIFAYKPLMDMLALKWLYHRSFHQANRRFPLRSCSARFDANTSTKRGPVFDR